MYGASYPSCDGSEGIYCQPLFRSVFTRGSYLGSLCSMVVFGYLSGNM